MQRRRPPRSLRPEERELWHEIARSARPLSGRGPFEHDPHEPESGAPPNVVQSNQPRPPAKTLPRTASTPQPLARFRIGERAALPALVPATAPGPAKSPLRMDARAFARLSRGKLAPEGRIDLHGLTLAQAQPELARFITRAHASGARLVLVITGKGRAEEHSGPMPRRIGALRREVPHWLSRPPLAPLVLQVTQAHQRHGGEGAYYVYLRRG